MLWCVGGQAIIERLKLELLQSISRPQTSSDQALSNASMLIDLLEPAPPILASIFGPRADKLKAEMRKCVEMQAVALKRQAATQQQRAQLRQLQHQQHASEQQLQQQQQQAKEKQKERAASEQRKKNSEDAARKRGRDDRNPFGEDAADADEEEGTGSAAADSALSESQAAEADDNGANSDADGDAGFGFGRRHSASSVASTASAQRKGSVTGSVNGGDRRGSVSSVGQLVDADGDDELLDAGADLLSLLQAHVLSPAFLFISAFSELLLRPLELQQSAAKKPSKAKAESLAHCQAALQTFTTALFDDYLAVVKKELSRRGNLVGSAAAGPSSLATSVAVIGRFTAQVAAFEQSMERIAPLVPRAGLPARVRELVELAIRHCVESVVELTQAAILDLLVKAYADVSRFDALQHADSLLLAQSLSSTELHRAFGSSEQPTPPSGLPSPAALATAIRVRLEELLHMLAALLDTKAYLKEDTAPGEQLEITRSSSQRPHDRGRSTLTTAHLCPALSSSQPWPTSLTRRCRESAQYPQRSQHGTTMIGIRRC